MELKKKKNSGTRTHACKTHVHYRQTGKKKKKKKTCIGSSFSHLPILHAHTRIHTNVQTISYCTYSFFFFFYVMWFPRGFFSATTALCFFLLKNSVNKKKVGKKMSLHSREGRVLLVRETWSATHFSTNITKKKKSPPLFFLCFHQMSFFFLCRNLSSNTHTHTHTHTHR